MYYYFFVTWYRTDPDLTACKFFSSSIMYNLEICEIEKFRYKGTDLHFKKSEFATSFSRGEAENEVSLGSGYVGFVGLIRIRIA